MRAEFLRWVCGAPRTAIRDRRTAAAGLILACALSGLGLGGCSQSLAEARLQGSDIRAAIAKGEMHSPKSAAVALSSIEGGPDDLVRRFKQGVKTAAGEREITITDPTLARYFVRGYLDAFPTDKGTSLRFVWDVFDANKRRVERLDNALDLPGSEGDPWAIVDDKVLAEMAARSADTIAAYLATTPEAAGSTSRIVSAAVPAVGSAAAPSRLN